jgi:hypothetical protein
LIARLKRIGRFSEPDVAAHVAVPTSIILAPALR